MKFMPMFEFWLSNDDTDRLFSIKNSYSKSKDLTGNEFARELLEKEIDRLHPRRVEYDEDGNEIVK